MTMTRRGSIATVLMEGQKQQFGYDTVAVRFIKQCPQGNLGETVNKSSSVARSLVERGLAVYFTPPRHIVEPQGRAVPVKALSLLKTDGTMSDVVAGPVAPETKASEMFGPTKEQIEAALKERKNGEPSETGKCESTSMVEASPTILEAPFLEAGSSAGEK